MSVDLRTRADAAHDPVDAAHFFGHELPALLDARQHLIEPGARDLSLPDFCLDTEGEAWTLRFLGDRVVAEAGTSEVSHARITQEQLTDLVFDQTTPIALMSNNLLDMPKGGLPDFLNWWLVLRAALDERRIHARGDIEFEQPPRRSFTLDDSDDDMRAFIEEAGYLHIRGLFTADEMAAVAADYPIAAPHFEKGDPKAWIATTSDGVEHLVRMEGFDRYSTTTADLIDEDRFQRIGRIPGVGHTQVHRANERVSALTKPIGVVKGISDVPWHKDCSLGRHSYECCSLTVGISVTGGGAESGQLRVLPGSHRALVWPAPCVQPGLDLEPVDLPTETGDVTIHLSCTQHMAQPPVKRTRKVLYTGFAQEPLNREMAKRGRDRLGAVRSKTHTSVSQPPGYLGKRKPS